MKSPTRSNPFSRTMLTPLTPCAFLLAVLVLPVVSFADVVIVAAVDGDISGGVVDNGSNFVQTILAGGGVDVRGIFEFDVRSIPVGSIIHSVEFTGYTSVAATGSMVQLSSYVGTTPIQIETADYSVVGTPQATLSEGVDLFSDSNFGISLSDLNDFQAAVDSTGVFGLRSQMLTPIDIWRVGSLEFSEASPSLNVNFTAVPEPNGIALGLLVVAMASLKRRKTKI